MGGFVSYTVGSEAIASIREGVKTFVYEGFGTGVGQSASISAPYYGVVWNLEELDDYAGPFWSLAVEVTLGTGAEFILFGAPGANPFVGLAGEGTWGVSIRPTTGLGASASYYETNFVPTSVIIERFRR